MSERRAFPPGFVWGASTSAYAIEGAPLEDGAGQGIWHRFSHTPGRIANGENGDVAADHYHRYREDVALMRELGLRAYRFSISWSRILPEGTGGVNEKGLDFYRRLVDELLESGIQPLASLHHRDLPAALSDRGGWLNRDVSWWFADYANVLFRALDDRGTVWTTIDDPWTIADHGYLHGVHAPGHRNPFEAPLATHNLLRAHSAAVQAYRAAGRNRIGAVVGIEPKYPATDSEEDIAATKRADAYANRMYLDPLFFGSYPTELQLMFAEAWPAIPAWDFAELHQPIDFLGIDYYTRSVVRHDPSVPIEQASRVRNPGATTTEHGREVFSEGLTDALVWVSQRYGKLPIYVTGNGAAFYDPPTAHDGRIDDPLRIDYYQRHLGATLDAIARGVDVRGYFASSLLDGFDWSAGTSRRTGIVHVDYATQQRTPKASARFLASVIRENAER